MQIGYGGPHIRKEPHRLDPLAGVTVVSVSYAGVDQVKNYDGSSSRTNRFAVTFTSGALPQPCHVTRCRRFCRLFSPELARFLYERPDHTLSAYEASMWGFSEWESEPRSGWIGRRAASCELRRVAMGGVSETTDQAGESSSTRGLRIKGGDKDVIYGSRTHNGPLQVIHPNPENPKDPDPAKLEWFPIYLHTLSSKIRARNRKVHFSEVEGAIVVDTVNKVEALTNLFELLKARPTEIIVLKSPRARAVSKRAYVLFDKDFLVPFRARDSESGDCLWLSLFNAGDLLGVTTLSGTNLVSLAEKDLVCVQRLGGLSWVVDEFVRAGHWDAVTLKRIYEEGCTHGHAARSCDFTPTSIMGLTGGIYIVRLIGKPFADSEIEDHAEVDHAVVIDTENELIWDSVEKHPMGLSYEALECCVGDNATLIDVREVRKLQRLGKKRKNSSRVRKRQRDRLTSGAKQDQVGAELKFNFPSELN